MAGGADSLMKSTPSTASASSAAASSSEAAPLTASAATSSSNDRNSAPSILQVAHGAHIKQRHTLEHRCTETPPPAGRLPSQQGRCQRRSSLFRREAHTPRANACHSTISRTLLAVLPFL